MSFKTRLSSLLRKRVVWFFIGVFLFPTLRLVKSFVYPTPLEAMGWVGFYEENMYLYPLMGDHSYTLSFGGNRVRFEKFARALGFANDQINENEYRKSDPKGEWSSGVRFDEKDTLKAITFYSQSR